MSITVTTDVFCDICESNWVLGYVGAIEERKKARKTARDKGWNRKWNKRKRRWEDICPRCQLEPEA